MPVAGVRTDRFALLVALVLAGLAAFLLIRGLVAWGWRGWYAQDLNWYVEATRRLLSGGSWFLGRQLEGPYPILPGDILYPPVAALWFAAWTVLPAWTFIVAPIAITTLCVYRHRPAPWSWPLMAMCLVVPDTQVKVIAANPGLWIMAAVALGTVYRWPAAFVVLKPTLAPFALLGVRDPRAWLMLGGLAVLSLPFLAPTVAYPSVLLDARGGGLFYSAPDLPLLLLPVVAWVGRRSRTTAP